MLSNETLISQANIILAWYESNLALVGKIKERFPKCKDFEKPTMQELLIDNNTREKWMMVILSL
jgi:hypothetical protein